MEDEAFDMGDGITIKGDGTGVICTCNDEGGPGLRIWFDWLLVVFILDGGIRGSNGLPICCASCCSVVEEDTDEDEEDLVIDKISVILSTFCDVDGNESDWFVDWPVSLNEVVELTDIADEVASDIVDEFANKLDDEGNDCDSTVVAVVMVTDETTLETLEEFGAGGAEGGRIINDTLSAGVVFGDTGEKCGDGDLRINDAKLALLLLLVPL